MKKMIHIAVVPGLAVLLSACAGPAEQRLDQIEESLRNLDEKFGTVTKKTDATVMGLKEDFTRVEKQLGGMGDVKTLYRKLTYRIDNLDTVDDNLARASRTDFVKRLRTEFKEIGDKWKGQKDLDKFLTVTPEKGDDVRAITFEFKDLENGIDARIRDDIEGEKKDEDRGDETREGGIIETVTSEAGVRMGISGIPVVVVPRGPEYVRFVEATVDYSSVSGIGGGGPDLTCYVDAEFRPGGLARQPNANAWIYNVADDDITPNRGSPIPVKAEGKFDDETGKCAELDDTAATYVMVYLEGDIRVAEYHRLTLTAIRDGTTSIPQAGGLTREKPACPPNLGSDPVAEAAAMKFEEKLMRDGGCVRVQ